MDFKPGDWQCSNCKENNFAKRDHCRKCNNPKGNTQSFGTDQWQVDGFGHAQLEIEIKKGDWICPSCQNANFSRNAVCRKCGTQKVAPALGNVENPSVTFKPGDWQGEACKEHIFKSIQFFVHLGHRGISRVWQLLFVFKIQLIFNSLQFILKSFLRCLDESNLLTNLTMLFILLIQLLLQFSQVNTSLKQLSVFLLNYESLSLEALQVFL